jgi:FAD/FMN-containing dehydrogenase
MSALDQLQAILGNEGLLLPGADLARYIREPRGRFPGDPLAVARPDSTEQLAQVVRICAEHRIAMVPQGGLTGLVGGGSAAQGELIISTERMRAIRDLDVADASVVVEAGCPLGTLRQAVAEAGLLYPVSLASEGSATVGGTLATNAGGNLTIRHGNTRAQVLGLEVVLADGRVWSELSPLRKNNTGYNLAQLFVGSEGTLGIITAAALKLAPAPRQELTALLALPSIKAGMGVLAQLRAGLGETLSACEFLPRLALEFVLADQPDQADPFARPHAWYVLVQADSSLAGSGLRESALNLLEQTIERGLAEDAVVAESRDQAARLWRLREGISAAQKHGGSSLKHDVSVPVGRIPAFIEQTTTLLEAAVPGIRPCIFGHLGDGNLHFNLSRPNGMTDAAFAELEPRCNRIVFDQVARVGGSIAAEHGIGQLRREELARSQPLKAELIGRIKQALDPFGLLNPGKIVVEKTASPAAP